MPVQLLAVGVIVIIAVIGAVVPFVAVKPDTLPEPLAPNPIKVLLLVHVKVAPDTGLPIVVDEADAKLQ